MADKTLIDLLKTKGSNTAKLLDTGKNIIKGVQENKKIVEQVVPAGGSIKGGIDYIKGTISGLQKKETTSQTPYIGKVGVEVGKGLTDTGTALKEIKTNEKSKPILVNNLYQAVSAIPAAIITPAVSEALKLSGQEERIAKALIDLGKKEANLGKLKTEGLTDQDYMNLGATNIDAGTAIVTLGLSKLLTSSLIKGLKIKGTEIKTQTPKVEVPKTEVPKTEVPKIEVPKIEVPKIETKPLSQARITELIQQKVKPLEIKSEIKPLEVKPLSQARITELIQQNIKTPGIKPTKAIKIPTKTKKTLLAEIKQKQSEIKPKKIEGPLDNIKINEILKRSQPLPELKWEDIAGPTYKAPLSEESITSMLKNQKPKVPDIKTETPLKPEIIKPIEKKETPIIDLEKERVALENKSELNFGEKTRLSELNSILTPKEENVKNIVDLVEKDINKTKDLDFELGITQQLAQKLPIVKDLLNLGSKGFIDIRNKLNNILVKTNEGVRGLGDTIMGLGVRKKQIIEQIVKEFGLEDLTNWSKENSKILSETKDKLNSEIKELFNKNPAGYEVAKSHLNKQYYEGNFKNSDLDNLRFISNIYFYLKNLKGIDISDKLPINIKNKLDEIEQKVGVRYDDEGNPLNMNSTEYKMLSTLGDLLENKGLLRYKKEGYKRGVINREVFEFLKKNQKELGLDKIPEFDEFIRKGYDTTIQQTGDIPKWMSSILKKSKNLEAYHSQDPITRMISYADEVGQLVMNKEVVDFVNKSRLNEKINQYIGKDSDDFIRKILGLHDISGFGKNVGKLSGGLGATAIIGNLPIMLTSGFTTGLRTLPIFLKNILNLRFKNDVKKSIEFLEKSGIEQNFTNQGLLDKIVGGAYFIFGGGAFDKNIKGFLTSLIIRNQLNEKGIKLQKGDNIVQKYQDLLDNLSANEQNILISDLGRQLSDLSDFSNLSRGQVSGLDSRIFNTFKNFSRTTASRYLSYPTQIINELYSTIKNKLPKGELGKSAYQKLTFLIADTLGVYYGAKLLVDKLLPKETEEKKEILANKLAGGGVVEKLAYLLSFPIQQPGISMINSTFNNIVKLATELAANGIDSKGKIDYLKISGLVRQLSLLMKEKELTSGGTYKYSNEWGDSTIENTLNFLLGFSGGRLDYEEAKKQIEKVKGEDRNLIGKVVDKILKDQNFFYSGLGETVDIGKYAVGQRDNKNEFYNFKVRTDSKKNIDTLLSNINYNKNKPLTAEQWLAGAWDGFDIKYDNKDILTFMKNNLASNTTEQKALLKVIDEMGINNDPLYRGDMNSYMDELKTRNPALFYQIMKKVINPVIIKIDGNSKQIKDLEYTGSQTGNSFVDEILVERFENLPRIASDITNQFGKVISENPTKEDIESYNTLLETTKQLPYLWDDIRDSMATLIGTKLKEVEGITDMLEGQDNVKEMLKQAAILRGIKFTGGSEDKKSTEALDSKPTQNQITANNNLKSNLDLKGLLLNDKKKISPLPQITTPKKQISPLTTQVNGVGGTTLAEILRKR